MNATLTLAGWYGKEDREVEITTEPSRAGIKVTAYLPGGPVGSMEYMDGESESRLVTWDELESSRYGQDEEIRNIAAELARKVSK